MNRGNLLARNWHLFIAKRKQMNLTEGTGLMEALDKLVTAAREGDLSAFGHIVQRFQSMAFTIAYTMLDDSQLAEDVAQEAFIEAYLNLPKLRDPQAFPGWFRRIVVRQGDHLIRGKRVNTVPLESNAGADAPLDELNPASLIEGHERRDAVRQAIATLPEHERSVVLLFYGGGYALNEIAQFLEVPLSTVKKRLFDARKHLKTRLMHAVHETLREQPSWQDQFPLRVQLLLAIRLDDIARVRALIRQHPLLVTEKWTCQNNGQRGPVFVLPVGYTPLHEAAAHDRLEIAALLLDYGANINARTPGGLTPLHEAVFSNHRDMARFLLAHGACVNSAPAGETTLLHGAVMKGYQESARLLLEHGADANTRARSGRTPLHWAALKGYATIVELLLSYGARVDLRDELGRTPLDWALARGQHASAQILRAFDAAKNDQDDLYLEGSAAK
jgi:RNA polymerase sigma factor (sigma-70 family)